MSTPNAGGDPEQGAPPSGNGGFSSPPPPPPPAEYGQAQGYAPAGAPGAVMAGFWIRFLGAFIDGILLAIVAFILGLIIGMDTVNQRQILSYLLGAVYFTYFHTTTGQSLGQKLVNVKVVDEATGGTIDFVRAFIRWLVSIVSGLALLIGYLWMLWDPKKQTWHDKASKTLVIKT